MSNLFLGRINLTKIDKDKLLKSDKTTKNKHGKEIPNVWMDVTVWLNDTPDKYGNTLAIQQSTSKDEPKVYIGNCKPWQAPKNDPVEDAEVVEGGQDDTNGLPF